MPLISAKCSQCGATINLEADKKSGSCPYCGAKYVIEPNVTNVNNAVSNYVVKYINGKQAADSDDLVALGDKFLKLGEYIKALESYKQAADKDPLDWRAYYGQFQILKFHELKVAECGGQYKQGCLITRIGYLAYDGIDSQTTTNVISKLIATAPEKEYLADLQNYYQERNARLAKYNQAEQQKKLKKECDTLRSEYAALKTQLINMVERYKKYGEYKPETDGLPLYPLLKTLTCFVWISLIVGLVGGVAYFIEWLASTNIFTLADSSIIYIVAPYFTICGFGCSIILYIVRQVVRKIAHKRKKGNPDGVSISDIQAIKKEMLQKKNLIEQKMKQIV